MSPSPKGLSGQHPGPRRAFDQEDGRRRQRVLRSVYRNGLLVRGSKGQYSDQMRNVVVMVAQVGCMKMFHARSLLQRLGEPARSTQRSCSWRNRMRRPDREHGHHEGKQQQCGLGSTGHLRSSFKAARHYHHEQAKLKACVRSASAYDHDHGRARARFQRRAHPGFLAGPLARLHDRWRNARAGVLRPAQGALAYPPRPGA